VTTAEVERLSRRAGFVFAGVVERTNATTMDVVEPTKETAVVRVERVLRAPADFGERKGTKVTVRLASPARKGQRAVFYTVGWISGTGLAVLEVGRQPARDLGTMSNEMEDAARKEGTAALRKRVADAAAVVVGKVADTEPYGKRERPPASEHDPLWRTAVVVVERAEKGEAKEGQRLEIAYASSRDVMWFRAPKPEPGDRAVFLAHRRTLEELDVQALAIVDPLDLHPAEELDRIRSVMRRT
jgi:hypothetical protein